MPDDKSAPANAPDTSSIRGLARSLGVDEKAVRKGDGARPAQPSERIVTAVAPLMDDFRVGFLKGTVFIELDRAEHLMFFVVSRATAQALAAALSLAATTAGDPKEDSF